MTPMLALLAVPLAVPSPDGQLVARLSNEGGSPKLAIMAFGKPIFAPAPLGLELADGRIGTDTRIVATRSRTMDQTWTATAGKTRRVRDRFRETVFTFQTVSPGRRFDLTIRAYDDGIAFRYTIPKQPGLGSLKVKEELTQFRPIGDPKATALVLPNTNTPYEELYQKGSLGSLDGKLIGFPLLLEYPKGPTVALTEADLNDFAGLYVTPKKGTLVSHLSPRLDRSGLAVSASLPHATPWRVVMIARSPALLVESNLVLNLNPPSVLQDTSWIKPGKTSFPWWNGYDTGKTGIKPAQTTEYHKWCIDFDATHGIPYHSLDGLDNIAWYGGTIVPYQGGTITKGLPGLDLAEILRYAKSKGVKIRVWMNSAAAKAQMAVAYPEYHRMGIEGVMVDFFDHDDQDTVNLVRRVVKTAADNHLTVTLHNLYKPTGLQRTYPNLMTFEAARNLEFDKWDPKGITPEHELTIPFVRMLAGPVDFHSGSFRNVAEKDFKPINVGPVTIGTRARQLARYVVYEGALPMVADSPVAYQGQPGFSFLTEVPTTWDETRVLAGEVGIYIVVVRRKGRDWYLGAMTDSSAREIKVPLYFLGGRPFTTTSWEDGPGGPTSLKSRRGTAGKSITLHLAPAGGAAVRFRSSLRQ